MDKPLVIITGASSGIGAATAKVFSQAGYPLALLARNLIALQELKLPNSLSFSVDITDIEAVKKTIAQAEKEFGPVDCLINNAGFVKAGEFTEISHADHEKMIAVNLNGMLNCIEAILPEMRKRKAGTIINMSSLADRNSRPNIATYAATKAAVKNLTESLRASNAKYNVRICNLAPAKVKTPMMQAVNIVDDDLIDADHFAKMILWIYQQPQNICIRDLVVAPTRYEL